MSICLLSNPSIMGRYIKVIKGGDMIDQLPDLKEQVQTLQKEVADLRVTVARLEQIVLAQGTPTSNNKNRPESRMPSFL